MPTDPPDPAMQLRRREELQRGIRAVQDRIRRACDSAARDAETVRLIAVSKFKPAQDLRLAHELGVRDFGENYVQELLQKKEQLRDLPDLRLHMIGHLQRNKARHLLQPVGSAALQLHTVDDVRLVAELQKRVTQANLQQPLPVFAAVNIAREPQKHGCAPELLPELLQALSATDQLRLEGLMTIPPWSEDPEASRVHFRALRELKDTHCPDAPRLSMGMSHDFEVAIAEGATDVRVGTAIFGKRDAP